MKQDHQDGYTVTVQCFTIEALVDAYIEAYQPAKQKVELLVIDVSVGEVFLVETLFTNRFFVSKYYC